MNDRLIHDASIAMARAILDRISPCLRDEEKLEALRESYLVCKAGIEAFCIHQERMLARLNPTKN
jgi:hypothetical protein